MSRPKKIYKAYRLEKEAWWKPWEATVYRDVNGLGPIVYDRRGGLISKRAAILWAETTLKLSDRPPSKYPIKIWKEF